MNKKIFSIFLLGILFFGIVSAEIIINPSSGVQYEEGIVDLFESGQEWVEVGISFKDNSGIELVGTKEEKLAQIKLKDEWFDMEINNFIGNLSNGEYGIIGRVSNGLSLNLSKSTFDKIIKDERIEKIELPTYGTIQYTNGENNKSYYWVFVSVILLFIFFILLIKFYKRRK